ncbi:MAG: hypothetical protein AAB535_00670 [Patescibacteria group bacterium]
MNAVVTVSSKNQITLPSSMVLLLSLSKGSKLWAKVKDNSVILEKESTWDDLQGVLADHPMSKKYTTLQIIELAKKLEANRLAKKYDK